MSSTKIPRNGFSKKIRKTSDTHTNKVYSDLVSKTLVAEHGLHQTLIEVQ
jgi:hypothetical protein